MGTKSTLSLFFFIICWTFTFSRMKDYQADRLQFMGVYSQGVDTEMRQVWSASRKEIWGGSSFWASGLSFWISIWISMKTADFMKNAHFIEISGFLKSENNPSNLSLSSSKFFQTKDQKWLPFKDRGHNALMLGMPSMIRCSQEDRHQWRPSQRWYTTDNSWLFKLSGIYSNWAKKKTTAMFQQMIPHW